MLWELLDEAPCLFLDARHVNLRLGLRQYVGEGETGQVSAGPPNGMRLSCGALKKESSFRRIYARRQLQALVRQHAILYPRPL
jgi:hypothetical protein